MAFLRREKSCLNISHIIILIRNVVLRWHSTATAGCPDRESLISLIITMIGRDSVFLMTEGFSRLFWKTDCFPSSPILISSGFSEAGLLQIKNRKLRFM